MGWIIVIYITLASGSVVSLSGSEIYDTQQKCLDASKPLVYELSLKQEHQTVCMELIDE